MRPWPVVVGFFFVLTMLLLPSFADEPPAWYDFEVASLNGEFVAKVTSAAGMDDRNPWNKHYIISVYQATDETEPIWSTSYIYDGYSGGMLSDDGSVFVYVNFWYYHDDPVVYVYRSGDLTEEVTGKELGMVEATLSRSVSHTLWLKDENSRFVYGTSRGPKGVEIPTLQGIRTVEIDQPIQ